MRAPLLSRLLVCFLMASPLTRAVELSASGISVPFFDAAGKLTHKMLAQHGTKDGDVQHLRQVEIHFFSSADSSVIVQKLEAAEATWNDRTETLAGDGPIMVATEENRLTGEGFDFALATAQLHIHRHFTMANREVVVTSERATVDLAMDRNGEDLKVRDVKRCEAMGNLQVVVQPTATRKFPFEKAFSRIAIYDGATQTVKFPEPIRTQLAKGREGRMSTLTINLKDAEKKPAPAPGNPKP